MSWIVTGTSDTGVMSEVATDEQHALERMYDLGAHPAYDAFTFSCYPGRVCESCDQLVEDLIHVSASFLHDEVDVCSDCAGA